MKRTFATLAILAALALSPGAHAQTDNTVYVKQFTVPATVGGKLAAAMQTCNPNPLIPCILVIDPSLAAFPQGVMPHLCQQCSLADYRLGIGTYTNKNFVLSTLQTWSTATAWGDSLTCGNQDGADGPLCRGTSTGSYADFLTAMLPAGQTVSNQGIGGQTSSQIAVRANAWAGTSKQQATITGGTIPASGGIGISFTSGYEPAYNASLTNVNAVSITVCGVSGTVSESGGHAYTFTRASSGTAQACAASSQWTANISNLLTGPQIIWSGYNNHTAVATVEADIDAMAAEFSSLNLPFLILSIPGGEGNGPGDYPSANTFWQINNYLAGKYSSSYVNLTSALSSAYDPTSAADTLDHTNGVSPVYKQRAQDMAGTLTAALGTTGCPAVNLTSSSTYQLEVNGILSVGSELIQVLSISGTYPNITATTCTRGWAGTTPASYSSGQTFTGIDWLHMNATGYTLVAQTVLPFLASISSPNLTLPNNNPSAISQTGGTGRMGFQNDSALDVESDLVSNGEKQLGKVERWWGPSFMATLGIRESAASYAKYANMGLFEYSNPNFIIDTFGPTRTAYGQLIIRALLGGSTSHLTLLSSDGNGAVNIGRQVLTVSTVAAMPTCSSSASDKGRIWAVTDATSPTYLGALTGGGTTFSPAICNGSIWVTY